MDCLILHLVVLYIAVFFCPVQSQDNNAVPPTFLNVSKNLDLQELLLEWDVNDEAYNAEKEMVFNIQINQTGASDVVWNENYTTVLNKTNRPVQWRWVSKAPLECMLYEIRIRSLVMSDSIHVAESWSNWSKSKTIKGMDIEDSEAYMFPKDKTVEEGSNVTFCCIAKKGEMMHSSFFNGRTYSASTSQRRMVFTVENVPLSSPGGIGVVCEGSHETTPIFQTATLYVTRPPGYPKNLSCETEDMVTLNCTWQPGSEDNLIPSLRRSTQFILSDTSKGEINCQKPSSKHSCLFRMGTQTTYHLSLTASNQLGKKQTNLTFDAAQRIHPAAAYALSVSDRYATAIELRWKMKHKLELLCQIESRHPDGNVDLHNSTSHSFESYRIVSGLQPYAKYTFRVRCGASQHFWKWSHWSILNTAWTKESAPSGSLDIWRNIGPGSDSCNVTVFWKPFPGFCANGEIKTYGISYEMLRGPMLTEVPASNNSTVIFLRNCSCKISVSAKNSVDSSPPSVIIPAASENDHIREMNTNTVKEDTTNNTETNIYISWKPQSQFDGYIIDWCNHPRAQPCDFQWKKFGQNQSSALISSDAFVPGVQYSFRVYGSLGNSAFFLEKKAKYLKELEPDSIPELKIAKLTSQMLTLTWNYNHLNESCPGFIRGYSIFVKAEAGDCMLEGSEKIIVQDRSVICNYTIGKPAKKTLTVKHPGINQEYWLQVLAFSTRPPNITDSFLDRTSQHLKKVTIPPDGSWGFQLLLLLVIFPLMLLICICFWRSDRVKNCCCPQIPHPTVTGIKALQMNLKTPLAASDLTPSNIIEVHKSQPWGCEKKQYCNQGFCAETPAVETFTFQNMTYFTEDANCYLSLHMQGVERQKPKLASYKPLPCFTLQSNLTDLNYVSQKDVPFPVVKQGNLAGPVEPKQRSDYKPQ